ncbi:unnamed protein product, partial [Hymenolepis diminuta]
WSVAGSSSKVLRDVLSFKRRGSENTDHLSTEVIHTPSDHYPTNIGSSHSQDADFVENVVIIETGLSKTSSSELQRKMSSTESLLRAVQRGGIRIIRER